MKAKYKGFEIEVFRDKCLGGWEMLFFGITRINDGYELDSGFSEEEATVREFIGYMKNRVDEELKDNPGIADPDTELEDGIFYRWQKWTCEKCGKTGNAKYQDDADAMSVIYAVEDDHQLQSSRCNENIERIRMVA